MNRKILGGVVVVVLGAAGLVVRDIPYTTKEEIVSIGGVRVSGEVQKYSPVPLIAGGALVVAGLTLIVAGGRKP